MSTTYQTSMGGASAFQQNAQVILGKRTNMLLVKDDVGRAKPATRKLPPKEVAFGKANIFNGSAADGKYMGKARNII